MSRSILVAIDLAHPAEAAALLKEAVTHKRSPEDHLAAVTVIPDFGMSIVGTFFKEGAEKEAMLAAAEQMHTLSREALGDDSNVQHVVRHGTVYAEMLIAADEVKADLIIMGAHKPDFGDFLLGPNALYVVRHAKASVLVLRNLGA